MPQQFGQAILTFAGDAAGEAPPKRVIIGSKTQLIARTGSAVDAVNNEILVPEDDKVLVFPREGSATSLRRACWAAPNLGCWAPKRWRSITSAI